MGRDSTPLTKGDAAKVWRGYPDTAKAVKRLIANGWHVVRQGKHYRAFWPPTDGMDFTISGTP